MQKFLSFLSSLLRSALSIWTGPANKKMPRPTTPGGLVMVMSTENPPVPGDFFANTTLEFSWTSERNILFKGCTHQGSQQFQINAYGGIHTYRIKDDYIHDENGVKTAEGMCPECSHRDMIRSVIRCCLCGRGILPRDAVTLYSLSSEGINHQHATRIRDNAVGCLETDCCPSGGFYAGKWTARGLYSPFNGSTVAGKAFSSRHQTAITIK